MNIGSDSSEPPVTQFRSRPGIIDLGWGHPHPAALPVQDWADASRSAVRRYGAAALTYGNGTGPGPLIEWLCERLGRTDGLAPRASQLFVTAGASHALDLVAALLCRPGDTVVVDTPTYHLALRVLADHGVDLAPAPTDAGGIDPEATRELVRSLRRAGRRVPMLYLVPTYNNPSGRSLSHDRRTALVATAADAGVVVVEDDIYRELGYDGPAPPSLFSLAEEGTVVRIGSFAKTVAPGLRLGWLTATPALVRRLDAWGCVDSGGGVNHTTALSMAEFAALGCYDRHVDTVRNRYRRQRDALVSAVRQRLPEIVFSRPAGGWFLWLQLPHPDRATDLLPRAEATGVSYLDGTRFYVSDTGHQQLRLSFSMYGAATLAEGVRRLATAYRAMSPASGIMGL